MTRNTPILYAELSFGGETIRLYGVRRSAATYVTVDGIEGWYSTPDAKWSLVERSYSDGAFPLDEADVVYASRVVTVHVGIVDANRAAVLERIDAVKRCAHREVRLRVVDDAQDTYCVGYATVDSEGTWDERHNEMELVLQCPDPRRLASDGTTGCHTADLYPASDDGVGGLEYGDDAAGLAYPLSYGAANDNLGNWVTFANSGTATAYPVVTVHPAFSEGFRIDLTDSDGKTSVTYDAPVVGTPVVLDFRRRTATCAGADRSRYLSSRGFRGVAPGGSLTLSLQDTSGSGWASVEVRDTYI